MKIRNGFVSNSSSSSFVILKNKLTETQIYQISNHIELAKQFFMDGCDEDAWDIEESDYAIKGYTNMNNFDMEEFLNKIGVHEKDIEWR